LYGCFGSRLLRLRSSRLRFDLHGSRRRLRLGLRRRPGRGLGLRFCGPLGLGLRLLGRRARSGGRLRTRLRLRLRVWSRGRWRGCLGRSRLGCTLHRSCRLLEDAVEEPGQRIRCLLGSGRREARKDDSQPENATRVRMEHDASANLKNHRCPCAKARRSNALWPG
jgi:hypothetical protein